MTKQEAIKTLENIVTENRYDANIRGFVRLYHQGGIHKMVQQRGMSVNDIIKMTETRVSLPQEIKDALKVIFA